MQPLSWFESQIGKELLEITPRNGSSVLTVESEEHAQHLYKTQTVSSFIYSEIEDIEEELTSVQILAAETTIDPDWPIGE